uniref:Uncharacterized protein n=1 Tax=Parastrongyloides trichosuri TaxID=131310 RepID=A0A0N4ZZV0_PARTI
MAKYCEEDTVAFAANGYFGCECGSVKIYNMTIEKCDGVGLACAPLGTVNVNKTAFGYGATISNEQKDNFKLQFRVQYTCSCCKRGFPACLREYFVKLPDENIYCKSNWDSVKQFGLIKLPIGTSRGLGIVGPFG